MAKAKIVRFEPRSSQQEDPVSGQLVDRPFFVAVLRQGAPKVRKSRNGRMYLTANEATMIWPGENNTIESLNEYIGEELEGTIQRVQCDPYEMENPMDGSVQVYNTRLEFVPDDYEEIEGYIDEEVEETSLVDDLEA